MNIVEVGQKVKKGAVLGYVGSTGNATGSHVHYEVWHDGKSVNPIGYIQGGA
jgi:murein DD-endopeptidase MepM/ murein hydrolase activator NlpD